METEIWEFSGTRVDILVPRESRRGQRGQRGGGRNEKQKGEPAEEHHEERGDEES